MDEAAARFADEVFARLIGGFEVLSIYVGDRLGLYRALAGAPRTVEDLADATGMHPRYAREWLEQQAAAGILTVHDGLFSLDEAHARVLADPTSLVYCAPLARMMAAAARRLPDLLDAYRSGGGVSWAAFGDDARDAQGDVNRPWFESELAAALASVPRVDAVLSRSGARIADVGCGHGWSTIALATAYPEARVEGFDVDAPSIEAARRHGEGTSGVAFTLLEGERLSEGREGAFDAVFVFEALHDMPDPVGVLTAVRDALAPGGIVVVMDEAVADAFTAPAEDVDRIMYGYSLFICLPDSMSAPGSVATGTVMRRSTLERYAREAGFAAVDVLPIEEFSAFRFYALTP